MRIEMQCEMCGEIVTDDDSETQTVADPDGGETEKGKCALCGGVTWESES